MMPPIWRGLGGECAPFAPRLEELISRHLKLRGHLGRRAGPGCHFGSTDAEQARRYTRDGSDADLRLLRPSADAVIAWAPGYPDLLMGFQVWLKELFWEGLDGSDILTDSRGDVDIIEDTIAAGDGAALPDLHRLIGEFLDQAEIIEARAGTPGLHALLAAHRGEIWITGACEMERLTP